MGDGLTLNPGAGSGQLIFLIRGSQCATIPTACGRNATICAETAAAKEGRALKAPEGGSDFDRSRCGRRNVKPVAARRRRAGVSSRYGRSSGSLASLSNHFRWRTRDVFSRQAGPGPTFIRGMASPRAAPSARIVAEARKRAAGRPLDCCMAAPVFSTSPPCSTLRRKFCL